MPRRRRVQSPAGNLPDFVRAFFAGGQPNVLLFAHPYYVCLHHFWTVWRAEHPEARPPRGFAHIAEAPPAMMGGKPYEAALAAALACVRRGERAR